MCMSSKLVAWNRGVLRRQNAPSSERSIQESRAAMAPWTMKVLMTKGLALIKSPEGAFETTARDPLPDDSLRSTSSLSLPARIEELERTIDPFLQQTFGKRTPPKPAQISGDYRSDVPKMIALRDIARRIQEQGSIGFSEAAVLFHDRRAAFMEDLAATFPDLNIVPNENMQMGHLRAELFGRLPLIKMPWRADGQVGEVPALLLANPPSLADNDLASHLAPIRALLDAHQSLAVPGDPLTAESIRRIKLAMPPETSAFVDYAILKAGGRGAADSLGISRHRQDNLVARLDSLNAVQLPTLMRTAEARMFAHGRTSTRSAILHQYRKLVTETGALKDPILNTERALEADHPELLELVRAAVRANTDSAVV